MKDDFLNRQLIECDLFEPILQVVCDTMPRNNLLNSACLELFEWIIRETPVQRDLLDHIVSRHREKLESITYVDTFRRLVDKYDRMIVPVPTQELEHSFTSVDSETPARPVEVLVNGGRYGQALQELDPDEEAYFNGSDDEEDILASNDGMPGASPVRPLVSYPEEEDADDDEMDILATSTPSASPAKSANAVQSPITPNTRPSSRASTETPPERISEKRRRAEEEEDELLANIPSSGTKRKAGILASSSIESTQKLRRKNSMTSAKDVTPRKLSIALPLKSNDDGSGGGGTDDI